MSKTLNDDEYEKLLDASAKLRALENGGVDNWEGYDISLEEYRESKEKEERLDTLVQDIEELVGTDSEIEADPAGHGTGFSICINKQGVRDLISNYIKGDK